MFGSKVLVAVWTAVYLTGYSDCLTGFHDPLSPPYRCHTGLKTAQRDHCLLVSIPNAQDYFVTFP